MCHPIYSAGPAASTCSLRLVPILTWPFCDCLHRPSGQIKKGNKKSVATASAKEQKRAEIAAAVAAARKIQELEETASKAESTKSKATKLTKAHLK